ncbi:MAG: hypothetical protein U0Y82_11165 [Thermoleophilia bacterium]
MTTISAAFVDHTDADAAVAALRGRGVPAGHIHLMSARSRPEPERGVLGAYGGHTVHPGDTRGAFAGARHRIGETRGTYAGHEAPHVGSYGDAERVHEVTVEPEGPQSRLVARLRDLGVTPDEMPGRVTQVRAGSVLVLADVPSARAGALQHVLR